jgi:hypothetical protein
MSSNVLIRDREAGTLPHLRLCHEVRARKTSRRQFLKLHKIKRLLPNDKRTVAGEQNLLLVIRVLLLVLLKHFDLFEAFEGERRFVAVLNQLHPSESAHAQSPNAFQFVQLDVTKLGRSRCPGGP